MSTGPSPTKPSFFKKVWVSPVIFILIALVVYFGNVELQSYLGRNALQETGLTLHELPEALRIAKEQNKLVLVDMSAIWCPTCRKLDKEIFADERVKMAMAEDYVFARVEYESEAGEAFMARYNVRGFPTLLVLRTNGEKIRQLPLTFEPIEFIENIRRVASSSR